MKKLTTVKALEELGRTRLLESFFPRDFLFSDIAVIHGLANMPDDADLAIAPGTRPCEYRLEPLQDHFGRVALRSSYRSWAAKIQRREGPERRIDSYTVPKGLLTKPGMANHAGSHEAEWQGIEKAMIRERLG